MDDSEARGSGGNSMAKDIYEIPLRTPPSTPRARMVPQDRSPPGAPRQGRMPPLLAALCSDNVVQVRAALEEDPQAASDLFWDHEAEPPLCCAARRSCDPEIVKLLLEHGADPEAVDNRGRTPLVILASTPTAPEDEEGLFDWTVLRDSRLEGLLPPWRVPRVDAVQRSLELAEVLMEGGAVPTIPDASGIVPLQAAFAAGNDHLVRLWLATPGELAPVKEDAAFDWLGGGAGQQGVLQRPIDSTGRIFSSV